MQNGTRRSVCLHFYLARAGTPPDCHYIPDSVCTRQLHSSRPEFQPFLHAETTGPLRLCTAPLCLETESGPRGIHPGSKMIGARHYKRISAAFRSRTPAGPPDFWQWCPVHGRKQGDSTLAAVHAQLSSSLYGIKLSHRCTDLLGSCCYLHSPPPPPTDKTRRISGLVFTQPANAVA